VNFEEKLKVKYIFSNNNENIAFLIKIGPNIIKYTILLDSSHFLQEFDNLEQKNFWPKFCGFGP
jgi:hypothetical protein